MENSSNFRCGQPPYHGASIWSPVIQYLTQLEVGGLWGETGRGGGGGGGGVKILSECFQTPVDLINIFSLFPTLELSPLAANERICPWQAIVSGKRYMLSVFSAPCPTEHHLATEHSHVGIKDCEREQRGTEVEDGSTIIAHSPDWRCI